MKTRRSDRQPASLSWLLTLGFALLASGCASKPEPSAPAPEASSALLRDIRPSPGFDTKGADCAGRLYRDTATTVSGASECKNGATVLFSGRSNTDLPLDLSCDYALFYTGSGNGNGRIACSDGSTGDFVFEEINPSNGIATARMKDGREIQLTYKQSF